MLLRAWVQQQSEMVSVWLWGSLQFTCRTKVALGSVSCTSAVGSHGLVSQPFPILWPRWADEMPHLQNRKAKWGGVCTKGQPDLPGLSLIQHADGITPVPIIPLNDAGCSGGDRGSKTCVPWARVTSAPSLARLSRDTSCPPGGSRGPHRQGPGRQTSKITEIYLKNNRFLPSSFTFIWFVRPVALP